jgi:hypothetical protein
MGTPTTNETLIKRARYGGRNVTGLAILATLLAGFSALALGFAKSPGDVLTVLPVPVIAVAYWLLSVGARRGNPRALSIVLAVLGAQLLFSVAILVYIAFLSRSDASTSIISIIIPLLVFVFLARNRGDLLELRRRGLWEGIYGAARPSDRLCTIGGVLLAVGVIALYSFVILSTVHAIRNVRLRGEFQALIGTDEKAFLDAVASGDPAKDKDVVAHVLKTADELEAKTQAIAVQAKAGSQMHTVAIKYAEAVSKWQAALKILEQEGGTDPRVQALFVEGDQLRQQAVAEFNKNGASQKK